MVKKRTPEEIAAAKAEGQSYLYEREKLASKAGITSKAAGQQLVPSERAEEMQNQSLTLEQNARIEKQKQEEMSKQQQLQQIQTLPPQVFQQPPTTQNELIAGPIFSKEGFAQIEQAAQNETLFPKLREKIDTRSRNAIDKLPEGAKLRAASVKAKQKINTNLLDIVDRSWIVTRGAVELGGSQLPFIGDFINAVTGNRKEKVNNYKASFEKRQETINSIAEGANSGIIDQQTAFQSLDDLELQLNEAETLIQEQIILSPAIRRSGQVEDIQAIILKQRAAIYLARRKVANAALQEANPEDLYMKLLEGENAEQ